jgi:hypothetical protein
MEWTAEQLIKAAHIEAKERSQNAAHGGFRDDGGASVIEGQIRFYEMGRLGQVPIEWEKYAKHIDPEYKELLRLEKKFRRTNL